jgi:tRNA U38,U39,U40 pseudouridine synthase TruA
VSFKMLAPCIELDNGSTVSSPSFLLINNLWCLLSRFALSTLTHRHCQSISDPAALGAAIRSHLPPDVTIFGAPRKVANSFNAKNAASARRYEYILPTYMFARALAPMPPCDATAAVADAAALPPPAFADDEEDMGGASSEFCSRAAVLKNV